MLVFVVTHWQDYQIAAKPQKQKVICGVYTTREEAVREIVKIDPNFSDSKGSKKSSDFNIEWVEIGQPLVNVS